MCVWPSNSKQKKKKNISEMCYRLFVFFFLNGTLSTHFCHRHLPENDVFLTSFVPFVLCFFCHLYSFCRCVRCPYIHPVGRDGCMVCITTHINSRMRSSEIYTVGTFSPARYLSATGRYGRTHTQVPELKRMKQNKNSENDILSYTFPRI